MVEIKQDYTWSKLNKKLWFTWYCTHVELHPLSKNWICGRRRPVLFLLYPLREKIRQRKENFKKKFKFYAYKKI